MKLLLFLALFVSLAFVRAQELDGDDIDISEYNGFDETDDGDSAEPLEVPDEGDDDDDDDDDEDEDEDEIRPTTGYPTTGKRWPSFKYKCMLKAKKCFMNATDCEDYLGCYEQKSACYQAGKKMQKPVMKMTQSKMICKTTFTKCLEDAGSDCFKKYMCYRKKGYCYSRSRGRGHRRPCGHHFRPHHRRPRPTMNPEMLKCKMQWKGCFMKANDCSGRLQCMYQFHDCMNRSRPTGPPPTTSPEEGDEETMNVYRRRWNPKLKAKCKKQFDECVENATSCPLKMRCFWRMKMCFKTHHRPHYGYKNKMVMLRINKFGGYGNRGMGSRYGQTGRQWGNRGMGSRYGQTGRQWGNRGMGGGAQTGGQWGRGREMGSRFKKTGREWANRGYKKLKKVWTQLG